MSDEPTLVGETLGPVGSIDPSVDETLEGPASTAATAKPKPPRELVDLFKPGVGPTRLGHYVLLAKLGQGGMGIVCAAYDEKLDRKVALKLLHAQGSEQAQLRLVREAQALARLSHPNVVQIYEIAEVEGLTFLVMEFVEGVTLREWLSAERRDRAAILAVLDAAGRGLVAAHAEGLVHRDFKPDNVMIRRDGRVLVMDFGLARGEAAERSESKQGSATIQPDEPTSASDDAPTSLARRLLDTNTLPHFERSSPLSNDLTVTGSLLGTPAYMAPEQFKGAETSPKTDQFAFCVSLWEALYGKRPFSAPTVAGLSLAVTSGHLTVPEAASVPTWLRKILERGLSVDAERRWPSMDALLEALRADPTRRRRWLAAGVGLVGLALVGTIGFRVANEHELAEARSACEAEGQAILADWTPDDRAAIERAFVDTGVGSAASAWTYTQRWVDAYVRDWSELRTQTCVETRVERRRDVDTYARISECLDEQRTTFAALVDAWHQPERRTISRAPAAKANLPPLSTCVDETWLAQRVRLPDDAHTREQVEALRSRLERARGLELAVAYDQGLAEARSALSEAEALGWAPVVAEAQLMVGDLLLDVGDADAGRGSTQAAFGSAGKSGHDIVTLMAATRLVYVVGHVLAQPEQGLLWAEVASMLIERMGLAGSLRHAQLLNNIAVVQDDLGRFDDALANYRRSLDLREAALGPDNLTVASSLSNIATTLMHQGAYDEALALFQRSLGIRERFLGHEHIDVAASLDNIGALHFNRSEYAEALAALRRALTIWESALGPDHVDVATTLSNMGSVLWLMGDNEAALAAYERALAIREAGLRPGHPDIASSLVSIASVQTSMGDHERALAGHLRATALLEQELGPTNYQLAQPLVQLGIAQSEAGSFADALASFQRALAIRDATLPPDHPDIAYTLLNLATEQLNLELYPEALASCERARALFEAKHEPGEDPIELGYAWMGIGQAHIGLRDYTAARDALERSLAIHLRHSTALDTRGQTRFALAQALWAMDEREAALEQARTATADYRASNEPSEEEVAEIDEWLRERE